MFDLKNQLLIRGQYLTKYLWIIFWYQSLGNQSFMITVSQQVTLKMIGNQQMYHHQCHRILRFVNRSAFLTQLGSKDIDGKIFDNAVLKSFPRMGQTDISSRIISAKRTVCPRTDRPKSAHFSQSKIYLKTFLFNTGRPRDELSAWPKCAGSELSRDELSAWPNSHGRTVRCRSASGRTMINYPYPL